MTNLETSQESPMPDAPPSLAPLRSAWPTGVACLGFFAVTLLLFRAYGFLHWQIVGHNYASLQDPLKGDLLQLLAYLEIYRLTGLVSLAFGVWAFRGTPRWIRWVCLPPALWSLGMAGTVM